MVGITNFVNLAEKGELTPYVYLLTAQAAAQGVSARYHRLAISDAGLPTPSTLADALALFRQVE